MARIKILNPKSGYNLTADYYARKEKYWDSFEKDTVLPMLGDLRGKKVLDVGAGTGRLAARMARFGADVTAFGISEQMSNRLHVTCYRLQAVVGDAENLPFMDRTFDIVIATFLIVHLKDLRRFFDETYRVLKDGGRFLVTNINQRKAPAVKTKEGLIEIESHYHRPEAVIGLLEELAFLVKKNEFVKEGDDWVNQIILAIK